MRFVDAMSRRNKSVTRKLAGIFAIDWERVCLIYYTPK